MTPSPCGLRGCGLITFLAFQELNVKQESKHQECRSSSLPDSQTPTDGRRREVHFRCPQPGARPSSQLALLCSSP